MTNRTDMVNRLRKELGDEGTAQTWSTSFLEQVTIEAAQWLSYRVPLPTTAVRDVTAGQRTFAMSVGWTEVFGVECPPGNPLPFDPDPHIGSPLATGRAYSQAWSMWGATIYLRNPASGPEVGAGKFVIMAGLPYDRPDPVVAWNGAAVDERLLLLYGAVAAWVWLRGYHLKSNRLTALGDQIDHYKEQLASEVAVRTALLRPHTRYLYTGGRNGAPKASTG